MSDVALEEIRRSVAMSVPEREAFLKAAWTARIATVASDGTPRVSPVWFVWCEDELWLHSLTRSHRGAHIRRSPRVAVTIDDGEEFSQLRGVLIRGDAVVDPSVPLARRARVEAAYAGKYRAGRPYIPDGRHEWIRITPTHVLTWDRAKLDR